MSGVQKLWVGETEIVSIDYSDCNEHEILQLSSEMAALVAAENKPFLALSIFNGKNFLTPRVMRHLEALAKPVNHLVIKMAVVGLSPTKKIILKGYNLLLKRDFKAFDSRDDAIAYLIGKSAS
jgi:hypothetical protein